MAKYNRQDYVNRYHTIHQCVDCGKARSVSRYDVASGRCIRCKSCSLLYRMHNGKHPGWKGGNHLTSEGYRMVTITKENNFFLPMAQGKRRYVLEHRLVMAKHLCRNLLPWETVHHKNGNKLDNSLCNLEVFPNPHKHNGISQLQRYIKKLETENNKLREQLTHKPNKTPSQPIILSPYSPQIDNCIAHILEAYKVVSARVEYDCRI